MINDKFIINNLKIISKKLKFNKYFLNKRIFKFLFIKKKTILEKINNLYKIKKNKNKFLENFFIKKKIKIYKNYFYFINNKINNIILNIPNIKNSSIKNYNKIIKYWNCKKLKLKKWLKINKIKNLDLKNSKNISGIKSSIIKNSLLCLYKSIIKLIINKHIKEHNYKEIKVPYITNYENIINSGQLPKFIKNLFLIKENKFLISTAEIPLINIIKNINLKTNLLPIKIFSITECFRKENKCYGKKNKGLIRQNQFEKIEIINFTDQKNSYNNLTEMIKIVEKILKLLKLSYRIILLSNFNTGFNSSKTFDIEVWLPSIKNFCEISSCSNTEFFQSEKTKVKYKDKKSKFIHILNASALPIGRTLLAIIENNNFKKKYIIIPKVLRKYMNKKKIIKIL